MLYQLFQSVRSEADFRLLINLTFTESERAMMQERWKIFEAFDRGLSQRAVSKEVPCSIATATRGARVFRENEAAIRKFLRIWRQT